MSNDANGNPLSIPMLKRTIRRFDQEGNVTKPFICEVSSPRGEISLQFGLTRHAPGKVMCLALTRTPLSKSVWPGMSEFISAFNRSSAIQIVADEEFERLMGSVRLPIDEFLDGSDEYLDILVLRSLPEAMFKALELVKQIEDGSPVKAVIEAHEAQLIAAVNAGDVLRIDGSYVIVKWSSMDEGEAGMN